MRKLSWVAAVAAVGLLLGACGGGKSEDVGSGSPVKVTIALSSTSFAPGLIMYADDAGFFEKHGLDVEFFVANSGADALTTVLSGDAQFAGVGITEPLIAAAQKRDVKLVATPYAGTAASVVLGKKAAQDTGVDPASASPEQLVKGLDRLSIASPSASSSFQHVLNKLQEDHGVKLESVYMSQNEMGSALKRGVIDGFIGSSPLSNQAVLAGDGVQWMSGPRGGIPGAGPGDTYGYALEGSASWMEDHPRAAVAVAQALTDAAKSVEEDPTSAKESFRKRFKDIDEDVFEDVWKENREAYTEPLPSDDILRQLIKDFPVDSGVPASITKLQPEDVVAKDVLAKVES